MDSILYHTGRIGSIILFHVLVACGEGICSTGGCGYVFIGDATADIRSMSALRSFISQRAGFQ